MASLEFTAENPLLLVTEFPADAGGGGAVIIRSLLRGQDRKGVVWLTLAGTRSLDTAVWPEQIGLKRGSAGKNASSQSRFKDSFFYSKQLAEEVLSIAAARKAKGIWVVLHGAAVQVAAHLIRSGKIPVHVTVHDDPPFCQTLLSRKLFLAVPLVERAFSSALRGAASIDVICKSMRERYKSRYRTEAVVVRRGVDAEAIRRNSDFNPRRDGLTIGVLGNIYLKAQLLVLGRAVAEAAARIGTPGTLLVIGQQFDPRFTRRFDPRLHLQINGHLDESAAVDKLQGCFLQYLNYPFAWPFRVFRQTSFPTKLSTYVMSGRPLLMHAPPDSSTTELAEWKPYCRSWTSNRVEDGADLLVDAWNDAAMQRSFHTESEMLRKRYFDSESNRGILLDALNSLRRPLKV